MSYHQNSLKGRGRCIFCHSDMRTLDFHSWSQHPKKVALVCGGRHFTYAEILKRASAMAGRLRALGATGQNVALLLRNSADLVCSYIACLQAGVTAVPLNPRATAVELEDYLTTCETRWLLVHGENSSLPESALDILSPSRVLLPVEDPSSWDLSLCVEKPLPSLVPEPCPAVIFFTSGSTQGPKGVMYSRESLSSAVAPFFSEPFVSIYGATPEELVYLHTASIADTVGCIHVLWTLLAGGTAVILQGFDADLYIDAIEQHRPTHSTLFLPHVIKLLAHPRVSRDRFRCLRMLCLAGDKTPVDLIQACREILGLAPLIGYGLTESFVVALNLSQSSAKLGSIGTPVQGVEVRITDEHNQPVPCGATGEILVRSPQNMLGYWRAPEATQRALVEGGWLKTGDLASVDEDGYIWFVGRKKHIIIRGGENISPHEVEGALLRHPAVKLATVVAARHPIEIEVPEAFVELREGMAASAADLMSFLERQLIDYKVPTAIHFVHDWPLTRTGKIDRRKLRRDP